MSINYLKLLTTGAALAATISFSQVLAESGLHAPVIAFFQAAGCAMLLFIADSSKDPYRFWPYAFVSSFLGYTLPMMLVLSALPHVGVGLSSLSYALPLLVTYSLNIMMDRHQLQWKKTLAVLTLTCGTGIYLGTSQHIEWQANSFWLIILLLSPISVGAANVFRGLYYPVSQSSTRIAFQTNLCSALVLAPGLFIQDLSALPNQPQLLLLLAALISVAALGQWFLFSLQRSASPVFVGQIGSVAMLFGGISGVLFFDEPLSVAQICGLTLILCGAVIFSQTKHSTLSRAIPTQRHTV